MTVYKRLAKQHYNKPATVDWAKTIDDNFKNQWEERPNCRIYKNSTTAVANATSVKPSMTTARYNTGGCWSAGNPSRLTAPRDGIYLLFAHVDWPTTNTTGYRNVSFSGFGTTDYPASTGNCTMNHSEIRFMAAGDWVELILYHTAGVSLTVPAGTASILTNLEMGMTYIGGVTL